MKVLSEGQVVRHESTRSSQHCCNTALCLTSTTMLCAAPVCGSRLSLLRVMAAVLPYAHERSEPVVAMAGIGGAAVLACATLNKVVHGPKPQ